MSATEKIQQSGGPFLESLRNAASENPVAAALIGAGVLWLFAGRAQIGPMAKAGAARVAEAASDAQRATSDAVASTWRSAKENVSGLTSRATAQAGNAGAAASDASDEAGLGTSTLQEQGAAMRQRAVDGLNAGAETLTTAGAQLGDMLQRQPLALGLIGLAVGAAVAAALPSTGIEDQTLGETSDALRDEAKQQMDRAANAASAAATKASEEARAQNLTADALKAGVEATATKLGGVADSAAETLRGKMRPAP